MASSQQLNFAIRAVNEASSTLKSIQDDIDGVGKKVDGANEKTGKFSSALGGIATVAGGFVAGGAIVGGFDKITGAIGDSIAGFKEHKQVAAQTEAVLKSTGGVAGLTARDIEDMAGAMKTNSLFTDDAIQSGENLLLTFTGIGKDVFPAATQTMVDMSQALGQDMSSSAVQLGKALNSPIDGVTALSRVGVSFTDDQKEQIKTMQESGDVAGAQGVILAELTKEFGGSAKAASDAAGEQAKLDDKMDDVQDTIGEKLLPAQEKWKEMQLQAVTILVEKVVPAIQQLIEWVNTKLRPSFEEFVANVKPKIQEFGDFAREKFAEFKVYYEESIKPAFDNIMGGVDKVVGWFRDHWPEISAVVMRVIEEIRLIVETDIKAIMGIFDVLMKLLSGDFSGAWRAAKGVVQGEVDLGPSHS